jgi:hypothetical protein
VSFADKKMQAKNPFPFYLHGFILSAAFTQRFFLQQKNKSPEK